MNVLAIVAHPDDEVLGCGGTLHKHAQAGDGVEIFVFGPRGKSVNVQEASYVLGLSAGCTDFGNLLDQRFDAVPLTQLAEALEESRYRPDIVYTHNPDDLNLDHELTARAVLTAFRPCNSQATILAFETLSSTEWGVEPFAPNWYVPLTKEQVDVKVRALDCYPTEVRDQPHPRNAQGIYTQAKWRGSQCGVEYAEAFRLLRGVA